MASRSIRYALGIARPVARARIPARSAVLAQLPRGSFASIRFSSSDSSGSSTPPSSGPSTPSSSHNSLPAPEEGAKPQRLGQIEPRLAMTFTCTAGPEQDKPRCGHRSTHEFSKKSYENGIVLVQCPECKARHLIADHLGWFKESTEDGKLRTVEDLLKAKGESIKKGRVNMDGDIEYAP